MKRAYQAIWSLRIELAFLSFGLLLGIAYLCEPYRAEAIRNGWLSLQHFLRLLDADSQIVLSSLEPGQVRGAPLAALDERLEFLGCDAAVTRGSGKTSVWHVTWWRARRPLSADLVLVTEFVPPDGRASVRVAHRLGQQFQAGLRPTSRWDTGEVLMDAFPLPRGAALDNGWRVRIRVLEPGGGPLEPDPASVLETDGTGWLWICE